MNPFKMTLSNYYINDTTITTTTTIYCNGTTNILLSRVPNPKSGSQGILGVGISMDQSATNQLVGNAQGVALWPPESIAGIPIVVSPNSTGDYVVRACLKSQGIDINDVEWIYEQQAACIEAMTPGLDGSPAKAPLGGLVRNPLQYTVLLISSLRLCLSG